MITDNDAIKAAETLKEWCKGRMCRDCKFLIRNFNDCTFRQNGTPEDWHIPKPRRWTNDDIQLAKALKNFGVNEITSGTLHRWNTVNSCGFVPPGAFADLKPGETVPIEAIISEEPAEQVGCRYLLGGNPR